MKTNRLAQLLPLLSIFGGVLAVIVAALLIVSRRAAQVFEQATEAEVRDLFARLPPEPTGVYQSHMLNDVPEPVARYLRRALPDGHARIRSVRLKQRGTFRLEPGGDWQPITAAQYFTTEPPAFIWLGRVQFAPFLWVSARDRYVNDQGNMHIRVNSALPVADVDSPQGALLRYLAEAMWFPTALLPGEALHWEAIDATSARAVMRAGDITGELVFHFGDDGDLAHVTGLRERAADGGVVMTEWYGFTRDFETHDGVRIPMTVDVGWKLPDGDFSYIRVTITDIAYDVTHPY